jgi:Spherulation-specific family 4
MPHRPARWLLALALAAGCEAGPAGRPSLTLAPEAERHVSLPPTATPPPAATAPPTPRSSASPSVAPASPSPAASPSPSPTATPSPGPSPVLQTGLMVPLYAHPTHASWAQLLALRARHPAVPVVAIVNVNSGPCAFADPVFAAGIARLTEAGIRCIGYVYTRYGVRPANELTLEMDRWHQHYPAVTGLFLDEVAADEGFALHYTQAFADARRRGFSLVVGNPGRSTSVAVAEAFDVLVAHERGSWPGADDPSAELRARFGKDRFAMLGYGTPAIDTAALAAATARFAWVYVTEDQQPDPWDSLSAHAEAIADAID